jgi:hypothetical protein
VLVFISYYTPDQLIEAVIRRLFTLRHAHVPEIGEPVRRRTHRAEYQPARPPQWRDQAQHRGPTDRASPARGQAWRLPQR